MTVASEAEGEALVGGGGHQMLAVAQIRIDERGKPLTRESGRGWRKALAALRAHRRQEKP